MAGPSLEFLRDRCVIDEVTGCWLWSLYVTRAGMPQGRTAEGLYYAHRAAWEAVNGPVPEGLFVYHAKCEHNHCINPRHTAAGTRRDQMLAASRLGKISKGLRHVMACTGDSNLRVPQEVVDQIRERCAAGESPVHVAREVGVHFSHAYRIVNGQARRGKAGYSVFNQLLELR